MTATAQEYVDLFSGNLRVLPNLTAWAAVCAQPFADNQNLLAQFSTLFSLADAAGQQLDYVGQLIGPSRVVDLPASLFFSFGSATLGFGLGIWYSPATATASQYLLDDGHYRLLLQAAIVNNHWDGTVAGAYSLWNRIVTGSPFQYFQIDNLDMTMTQGLVSLTAPIDVVTLALLTTGKLDVKPSGVATSYAYVAPPDFGPIFAFGMDTEYFKGFGEGHWATTVTGS
jgi:hypothetical protein